MEQVMEKETKYGASDLTSEQKQNTMLIEALFQDNKFIKLLTTVLSPQNYKKKISNIVFFGAVAVVLMLGFAVNSNIALWTYSFDNIPLFNSIMLYVGYSIFFKSAFENLCFKLKLKKFKNFFNTDKNFLSFLDCLSNNKYVKNHLYSNDSMANGLNEAELRRAFVKIYPNVIDETVFSSVVESQVAYMEARYQLKKYVASSSEKDLLSFLKITNDVISLGLKEDAMKFGVSDKSDLFRAISSKVGN